MNDHLILNYLQGIFILYISTSSSSEWAGGPTQFFEAVFNLMLADAGNFSPSLACQIREPLDRYFRELTFRCCSLIWLHHTSFREIICRRSRSIVLLVTPFLAQTLGWNLQRHSTRTILLNDTRIRRVSKRAWLREAPKFSVAQIIYSFSSSMGIEKYL